MLVFLFSLAFLISIFAVLRGVMSIYNRQKRKSEIEKKWKALNTKDKNHIKEHLLDD